MAALSKAWICSFSFAGIAGSITVHGMNARLYECRVLSGRGLCVGLNTRPEESYRMWCVCVWSWNPWQCRVTENKNHCCLVSDLRMIGDVQRACCCTVMPWTASLLLYRHAMNSEPPVVPSCHVQRSSCCTAMPCTASLLLYRHAMYSESFVFTLRRLNVKGKLGSSSVGDREVWVSKSPILWKTELNSESRESAIIQVN